MYTINDVVKGVCSAEQVWSQFVSPKLEMAVGKHFGLARLLASEDKYFHNIPLTEWEDFAKVSVKELLDQELFAEHLKNDKTSPNRFKPGEDGVCIAKQAAREFVRRVLLSRNDTENLARFSTMPWTPGDSI